jgi:hypothetical protein
MEEAEQRKPEISKKTAQLAIKSRQKLMGEKGEISLIEVLLLPGKGKDEWRKQELDKLSQKEVEGCSFRPQTLNYQSNNVQETHGDKCIDLFSKKPIGWFKDQNVKTSDDMEFEKVEKELKFKPQVNAGVLQSETNVQAIKGMDKVMERMNKAR